MIFLDLTTRGRMRAMSRRSSSRDSRAIPRTLLTDFLCAYFVCTFAMRRVTPRTSSGEQIRTLLPEVSARAVRPERWT